MSKLTSYKPKPIVMLPYPEGAQNAQQAAYKRHQAAIDTQMEMNKQHGGVLCPQAPMFGMSSSPGDANTSSCAANGSNWQRSEWARFDSQVGKVNPNLKVGGRRYKKSKRNRKSVRKNKRKTKSKSLKRRHTKKYRRKAKHSRKHKRGYKQHKRSMRK